MANVRINAVNVGEKANEDFRFINKRAENFWNLREWLIKGGELVNHSGWQELLNIRYKRELNGKIKIQSKDDMRREGIASPNNADALMLTFDQVAFKLPKEAVKKKTFQSYYGRNFK